MLAAAVRLVHPDRTMKKLTIAAVLLSLSIAAPVFACPMENHAETPRTAEKAKDAPKAEKAKAADQAKPAAKAKPADKVSQK
jgi:hypothetical protein